MEIEPTVAVEETVDIDRYALFSLAAQHLSVTWSQRTAEFASYLFLIDLFPSTLLPSALYGFFSTFTGLLFGGAVGSVIDRYSNRLGFIRINIAIAKLSVTSVYAFLIVLLVRYPAEARLASQNISHGGHAIVWTLYALVVLASCVMKLSDIAMSIAIERDWVTTISAGDDSHLTLLNLWLRRIDLGCKLVAPLFVGLLTSTIGNTRTAYILGAIALGGLGFEFVWINVVWKRFPVLAQTPAPPLLELEAESDAAIDLATTSREFSSPSPASSPIKSWFKRTSTDWALFIHHPVFPSSLAISLLYFTTLSFDGTMIAWLKTNAYSDSLISGMRGIAVCTGLAGTAIMPRLEKRIGLARAGNWSIWSEALSLLPVVLSFYIGSSQGKHAAAWNQTLLFGGLALSRIGLWSFDLCQLKLLQKMLSGHPRRNTINGMQFALQNALDVGKWIMVVVFSRPNEFKYTAAVSFGAVVCGACLYLIYLRRERGHVVHIDWVIAMRKRFT